MSTESKSTNTACPSREQILQQVRQIIAKESGVAADKIQESDDLEADLRCDSLTIMEIVMAVEDQFDLPPIIDESVETPHTVADIVDGIMQQRSEASVN